MSRNSSCLSLCVSLTPHVSSSVCLEPCTSQNSAWFSLCMVLTLHVPYFAVFLLPLSLPSSIFVSLSRSLPLAPPLSLSSPPICLVALNLVARPRFKFTFPESTINYLFADMTTSNPAAKDLVLILICENEYNIAYFCLWLVNKYGPLLDVSTASFLPSAHAPVFLPHPPLPFLTHPFLDFP